MSSKALPNNGEQKLVFLDGVRGIAAFYVMVGHARWLLWEGYQNYNSHPADYSFLDTVFMYFFSLFRFGHEFVLLFFVLSGFVIHYGYSKKLVKAPNFKLKWGEYLFRRAKRIYPPFLFAIALTFVLDQIGIDYGFTIYSGDTIYPSINTNVSHPNHEAKTLLGNFFFLFKEYVPVFGTNGATWSLKFEWWFYVLYPLFFLFSRKNVYYSTALIVVLFFSTFSTGIWKENLMREIFGSMICWWLGVILAEVTTKRINLKLGLFAMIALLACGLCYLLPQNSQSADLKVALLFTSILALLLWMHERRMSLKFLNVLKPLGDFSYTLYIIHFPILVLLSGVLSHYLNNTLPIHSYFIMAGMAICLVTAYLVHFIVEVPFINKNLSSKEIPRSGRLKIFRYRRRSTTAVKRTDDLN